MDIIDVGSEAAEQATAHAIAIARSATAKLPPLTGVCQNPRCGDDVDSDASGTPHRFCGKSCRDEWQHIQQVKSFRGN